MDIGYERSFSTPVSNSTLLPLLLLSLARQTHTPHSSRCIKDEYDYIVVGGGSAGSVVASRLSEEPCVSVLLLEAGSEPPLLTEVPGFGTYFAGTDVDWTFKTVPQKHAATAFLNRQISVAAGKMLGGSSSLNYMAYVRGNHKNYDDWAAQGAKGWSYSEVLPYFLRLEDFKVPAYLFNGYHAYGGPVTAELPRYRSKLKQATYIAARQLGYQFVDSNAERQTGFSDPYMNIRDGQRCSTAKAYLVPTEEKTNLNILLNATVTKIKIEGKTAIGVVFHHKGQFRTIKAKREVIVSAGTLNTPKILMLSGVGPRKELQKLNIPVIADLPVGKNLQDQTVVSYLFTVDSRFPSREEQLSDDARILQYIRNRSGPLAYAGYVYVAFLNGLNVAPPIDFPNSALFIGPVFPNPFEGLPVTPEVYKQFVEPNQNKSILQCIAFNPQPRSRGTVTLNSSNSVDPPLIDPNYFEDSRDLDGIVDAPLFVGTSKMGHPDDPTTVVDPYLRVKSIKGLRIVDASVMPIITSGNTNIPTIMVAEKASDIIKNSIRC